MTVDHVSLPSRLRPGTFHRFIVINDGRTAQGARVIRITWELVASDGRKITEKLEGDIAIEADRKVMWYLNPEAVQAWQLQRLRGWDGTIEKLEEIELRINSYA